MNHYLSALPDMGRSFHLGSFAGIPVKLHWTFGLLILSLIYLASSSGLEVVELFFFILLIASLFSCVVLHEYGHALTAKFFNVRTKDIIISPIGGVARLEKLPAKPMEELLIAIAGPLVNVVLAILCFVGVTIFVGVEPFIIDDNSAKVDSFPKFFATVFLINLVLFFFNLVPAFPMDGGRILRALLSLKLGKAKSTKIASLIGRFIAIGFMAFGLYISHYVLAIIGVFIFYMATTELRQVELEELLQETTLATIMRKHFTTLYQDDLMEMVVDLSVGREEKNFLVKDSEGNIVGIMHELFIKDAIHKGNLSRVISGYTSPKFQLFSPENTIYEARDMMDKMGLSIIGVGNAIDQIQGVVDRDDILRFMRLHS